MSTYNIGRVHEISRASRRPVYYILYPGSRNATVWVLVSFLLLFVVMAVRLARVFVPMAESLSVGPCVLEVES
jgi:hypothetical protein